MPGTKCRGHLDTQSDVTDFLRPAASSGAIVGAAAVVSNCAGTIASGVNVRRSEKSARFSAHPSKQASA